MRDFAKVDQLLRDMEQRRIFVNFRTIDQILSVALAIGDNSLVLKYLRHAEKVP